MGSFGSWLLVLEDMPGQTRIYCSSTPQRSQATGPSPQALNRQPDTLGTAQVNLLWKPAVGTPGSSLTGPEWTYLSEGLWLGQDCPTPPPVSLLMFFASVKVHLRLWVRTPNPSSFSHPRTGCWGRGGPVFQGTYMHGSSTFLPTCHTTRIITL